MATKYKIGQKVLAALLFFAILAPSFTIFAVPRKAEAQFTDPVGAIQRAVGNAFHWLNTSTNITQTGLGLRELAREILRLALQQIAKRILAEMTKSTVNWINTGHFGRPLFLENPDSFFGDITKYEIKNFINLTGYDTLRYPFAKDYILGVINTYKRQLEYNAQSSLGAALRDPVYASQYRSDFSVGGWNGLITMTKNPSENVIGFNLGADRLLVQRLTGGNSTTNQLKEKLQQGQGFLSPQICPSNPERGGKNRYTTDVFDPNTVPYDQSFEAAYFAAVASGDPVMIAATWRALEGYKLQRASDIKVARESWDATHQCPGGWQDTTPGFVVASQIIDALGTPRKNAELSAALGNSLAAIFDSLLNKFIGTGLTSLAGGGNNVIATSDPYSYYGVRLDDSNTNPGGWGSYVDEVIDLEAFKKEVSGKTQITDSTGAVVREDIGDTSSSSGGTYIPGAIINTALEIRIIDSTQPTNLSPKYQPALDAIRPTVGGQNPGLIQILDRIWPVVFELDQCIPGPNKDWEKRLDKERDRIINTKLAQETTHEDTWKAKAATDAVEELKFAVQSFKDWVQVKMITPVGPQKGLGLTNTVLYVDAVKSTDSNAQQLNELSDKRREKISALSKLLSIEAQLAAIITKPATGSPEEKRLIEIRKQFTAVSSAIATEASTETLQTDLDLAIEKLADLRDYNANCAQERAAAGWTGAGGPNNTLTGFSAPPYRDTEKAISIEKLLGRYSVQEVKNFFYGSTPIFPKGKELELFCLVPINSGYSHGEIIRPDESNKGTLFTFRNHFYKVTNYGASAGYEDLPMVNAFYFYGDEAGRYPVSADISCSSVFNTDLNTYKHAGDELF